MNENKILTKNTGIIIGERPEDYKFGANSQIKHEVRNATRDWRQFRSRDERQNMNPEDRMYCVTGSATNIWEQQANWMLVNNLWPKDALEFWYKHGFIVNGKFEISRRFTAKKSGTTKEGNYFYRVWDSIRPHSDGTGDGVVPDSMYPDDKTLSWNEYYKEVPAELTALGKESLKYFTLLYESIAGVAVSTLRESQELAPLQLGVTTQCGWGGEVPLCAAQPNHAIDNDHIRDDFSFDIFDSYDPYSKHLPSAYPIPICYRAVLYPVPAKPVPILVVPDASAPFLKDMAYGETSDDIGRLQKVLKVIEPVTRYYGNMTTKAVQKFMIDRNVGSWWEKYVYPAGRRVGPKVRAELNK